MGQLSPLMLFLFGVACCIPWVVREHRLANQYRELLRLHKEGQNAPLGKGKWTMVYKEGGATRTIFLEGRSEAEALQSAVAKHMVRYDKIVSLTSS